MNFLFAIKLSSDFLQGSDIYKLWENYTQICCSFYFAHYKGNNSYKKGIKTYFRIKWGMCKRCSNIETLKKHYTCVLVKFGNQDLSRSI